MSLFDKLFVGRMEKRIAAYQNELLQKHYAEVESMYRQMQGWRHDYHNHIQKMKAHLALHQIDALEAYLSELERDLTSVEVLIKTGNVMLDAILNSKLSLMQAKNIAVDTKAIVPVHLPIAEIDVCVLLGNLMDNAMEACENYPNAFTRVYIGILKKQLYISVANSVAHEPIKKGNTYTSVKNSTRHGFGLSRIDKIVKKHEGYINRQHDEGFFITEIMLPLSNPK